MVDGMGWDARVDWIGWNGMGWDEMELREGMRIPYCFPCCFPAPAPTYAFPILSIHPAIHQSSAWEFWDGALHRIAVAIQVHSRSLSPRPSVLA